MHDHSAEEEQIISDVEKYGFHIGVIPSDGYLPAFAYTIGLYQTYEHPEIICIGLSPEHLGEVLNQAGYLIEKKCCLETDRSYADFIEDHDVQFVEVQKEHMTDYFGYAFDYYQHRDFPALQLVWPDAKGFFPWENSFDTNLKFQQPLLDRNSDFKFCEERNLGVFTTRQVLEGQPILYVYHDENGDWQFHSEEDPKDEDGKIVCLEDLVKQDISLNEIYYLPYNWRAWRTSVADTWQTESA